jgi:hypothetical protein
MMRRALLLWFVLALFVPRLATALATPPPESDIYGAFPDNYEQIITAWLNTSLVDPASAQVKWLGPPRQGSLTIKGQKVSGYLVDFSVNVRNVFGAYTGLQKHTALIRDGKLVTATAFVYR